MFRQPRRESPGDTRDGFHVYGGGNKQPIVRAFGRLSVEGQIVLLTYLEQPVERNWDLAVEEKY